MSTIEDFTQTPPNLGDLQREHALVAKIGGRIGKKPNVYDCGVVSWPILDTGLPVNPTIGMIPLGHIHLIQVEIQNK